MNHEKLAKKMDGIFCNSPVIRLGRIPVTSLATIHKVNNAFALFQISFIKNIRSNMPLIKKNAHI